VLAKNGEDYLIYSLTSSQTHPQGEIKPGYNPAENTPLYFIPEGMIVGQKGYRFPLPTFIYFSTNVRHEPEHVLAHRSSTDRIDLIDRLLVDIHTDILYNLYRSDFIPVRLLPMVEAELERLCQTSK
jgi:hypothetical protein